MISREPVAQEGAGWVRRGGEERPPLTPPDTSTPACRYRRVVIRKAGGYGELRLEGEEDRSAPPLGTVGADMDGRQLRPPEADAVGREEVRVAVAYAGVNYADVCVRWGLYGSAKRYVGRNGFPITPGFEVAGTVLSVGSAVTHVRPGDRVLAVTLFGAYSTHLVCKANRVFRLAGEGEDLARESGFPDLPTAAGFLCVYLTAYYAAFKCAQLGAGHAVLVHSAAGGVGTALCQLAKRAARCGLVVGVVGHPSKVEAAKAAGCDAVIDKSTVRDWEGAARRLAESSGGFDAVMDANGGESLRAGYRLLRPTGKLVTYGSHTLLPKQGGVLGLVAWAGIIRGWLTTPSFDPMKLTGDNKSVLGFNLSFLFDRDDLLEQSMGEMLAWLREGIIAPVPVTCVVPLSDVADAHRRLESGLTTGKIVLDCTRI